MRRRAPHLAAVALVLAVFAACLGSGCARRAQAPEESEDASAVGAEADAVRAGSSVAESSDGGASSAGASITDAGVARGSAIPNAAAAAETAAAAARTPPDADDPAWTRVASRAASYVVCWRASTGKVPRNEDFELEAWVLRADGAPVAGAELAVSAWMPDHGHGMLRLPRTVKRDDGSFRVEGMLLHMRGLWQLKFDVLEGSLAETAECALEL